MSGAGGRQGRSGIRRTAVLNDRVAARCVQFGANARAHVENSPASSTRSSSSRGPAGFARIVQADQDELRTALSCATARPALPAHRGVPIGGPAHPTASPCNGPAAALLRPRPPGSEHARRDRRNYGRETPRSWSTTSRPGGSLVEAVLRLREAGIYCTSGGLIDPSRAGAPLQQMACCCTRSSRSMYSDLPARPGRISDDEHCVGDPLPSRHTDRVPSSTRAGAERPGSEQEPESACVRERGRSST